MSNPDGQSPHSNNLCPNCGRTNPTGTVCTQCQSEFLEELPEQNPTTDQRSDPELPLIHQFQHMLTDGFNLQSFTNTLLPMLMSPIQPVLPPYRHRRGRPLRRIKRVAYRYLPTSFPPPGLFNTQLFIIHQNEDNSRSEMFRQLTNEDMDSLPDIANDIEQLPTLTMTSSNLLSNPSCAICLENFDLSSEVKQLPSCHHVFHIHCLTEWLVDHNNCPMCRTNISSIQPRANPVFNNHWIQQLLLQTFGSPSTNLSYPSIKTINPPPPSSNPIESNPSSSDTPQLPRFDPSNTE